MFDRRWTVLATCFLMAIAAAAGAQTPQMVITSYPDAPLAGKDGGASVGRVEPAKLTATLDRFVFKKGLHPFALLAVALNMDSAAGTTLSVQIQRATDHQLVFEDTRPVKSKRVGVQIPIGALEVGEYVLHVMAKDGREGLSNRVALEFAVQAAQTAADSGTITLRQTRAVERGVERWQIYTGVPFPEGALWDKDHVRIEAAGLEVPAQVKTLATWSVGGSVKWLGIDTQVPLEAGKNAELVLKYGPSIKAKGGGAIEVTEDAERMVINTGAARFAVRKQGFNLLEQMWVNNKPMLSEGATPRGPYMVGEDGTGYWSANDLKCEVRVEERGALTTVVCAEGAHVDKQGKALGRYVVRMFFYSGLPYFRLQHTFIIAEDTNTTRYADIGVAMPVAGDDYRIGMSADKPVSGTLGGENSVSLLQRRWNEFVVRPYARNGGAAGQVVTKGEKGAGWIARGELAVLVRDFWQNFPKELEARQDGLVMHLWPGHGERVWSLEEEISTDVAWLLPFAHHGKLLNFKVPAEYYTGPLSKEYGFVRAAGNPEPWYGEASKEANGMGLGKTHDMLVAFGPAASPARVEALQAAFQGNVHFLADPAWNCATQVVGPMAAHDAQKFPLVEAQISGGFDYLVRWTLEGAAAFGMFNYGDAFTSSRENLGKLPHYLRLWAGYHHGRGRVPWLLYLRSGDPKYLDWGRANAQHLMDVDTCHYTTDAYDAKAIAGGRKLVGGMCDYKGFVHWYEGRRVSDYNSMVDFLQLDYYLTGNRRALDVMHETGELLIRNLRGYPSREGAGGLSATLDYFKYTWDARALLGIVAELPKMYTKPAIEHSPPSVQWAPYLEPWVAYSADPAARTFLMQTVSDFMNPEKVPAGFEFYGDGRVLAQAYELTGDKKYLRHAWGYYNKGPGPFENPGDPMHQVVDWLDYSYETQQVLPVMANLAQLPSLPAMGEIDYTNGRARVGVWGSEKGLLEMILPEKTDQEFTIGGPFFNRRELTYELSDPSGRVVKQGVIPPYRNGNHRLMVVHGDDGVTGDYKLRIAGPHDFDFETEKIFSPGTQRLLIPDRTRDPVLITGRFFFTVPTECETFSLTFNSLDNREARATLAIISPDDRPVQTAYALRAKGPTILEVKVPAEGRGKVWSLAARGCVLIDVQGLPRWLAMTVNGAQP